MTSFAAGAPAVTLDPLVALGLMGLLLCASFFFSGTETAFFSLQKVDLQRFSGGDRRSERALDLLSDHPSLITTLLLGNETANIALAATGAALVRSLAPEHGWLNVLLVTPLLVVVSEITPKVLAFRFNSRWVRAASPALIVFALITWLPRQLLTAAVRTLARLFRVPPGPPGSARLREAELRTLVGHGAESGALDPRERELIEAVFEFDDLTVARVMTPAPDIFRLSLDTPWDEVLEACRVDPYSRVPIYDGEPDRIVGVLTLKDLLAIRATPPPTLRRVRKRLRPAVFVPQSKPAPDMMREFLERHLHQAMVVDEHGTLVGLVTLDDLLGELDLGDEDEATQDPIIPAGPDTLLVSARMSLAGFQEETGVCLPEGEYHTVGGYVFHALGRLPRAGDVVEQQGYRFLVDRVQDRRIERLRWVSAPGDDRELG